jgi:hypothetical protein
MVDQLNYQTLKREMELMRAEGREGRSHIDEPAAKQALRLAGRAMSGVGGASDFAHAAALSSDAISVVAPPSLSGQNAVSHIVPRLEGVCSLPRQKIEVVVTEHGAAGCTVSAEWFVRVAVEQHSATLRDARRDMVARL